MMFHADADPQTVPSFGTEADEVATRARRSGLAAGVLLTLLLWAAAGADAAVLPVCLVFVPAGVAAAIDHATRTLPDHWVLATAAGGVTWALSASGATGVLGWSITALMVAVPVAVVHAAAPASMGFGDVKFAAAIGGSIGLVVTSSPERVVVAMVLLAVASGVALAYGVVRRRRSLPFGPCLLLGGSIAMVGAVQGAITT